MSVRKQMHLPIAFFLIGIVFLLFGCVGNGQTDGKKKKDKKDSKIYDFGYKKHGLDKRRPRRFELYKPEEVEAFARPTGPAEAAVLFAGDTMIWDRMEKLVKKKGWDYPFQGVAPLIKNADLAVLNLEGPLADHSEKPDKKGFFYKVPTKSVKGLVDAGFDAVTLANNHLLDCNEGGLEETMRALDGAGIKWFGAGDSDEKARTPLITEVKGIRIAQVTGISPEIYLTKPSTIGKRKIWKRRLKLCKRDLTMIDGANKMGTFLHSRKTLAQDIKKAKAEADVVIVNLHWGVRYWRPPFKEQVKLARAAKKAGADLIIGHHAHFWQPVEMMGNVPVIYGIGNFAFGSANFYADEGLLVLAVFSTETKKLTRVELFPTYIKNRDNRVNYQAKLFKGESAKAVLNDIQAWSKKLCNTDLVVEGDRMVINVPQI